MSDEDADEHLETGMPTAFALPRLFAVLRDDAGIKITGGEDHER